MTTPPYAQLTKGTFLIASPDVDSGVYYRTVILLCEHSTAGSFGVMINRPIEIELPEELINTKELANPHVYFRQGGPLQPNQMMLLHTSDKLTEMAIKVTDGVYLGGDLQFLQESINDPSGPSICLCFGYSGWNAGQLEQEFLGGGWFLFPASAKYIFETPTDRIWQTLLRDMGGKYASLSMIPEDLSLN